MVYVHSLLVKTQEGYEIEVFSSEKKALRKYGCYLEPYVGKEKMNLKIVGRSFSVTKEDEGKVISVQYSKNVVR